MDLSFWLVVASVLMASAIAGADIALLRHPACRGLHRIIAITNLIVMIGVVVADMVALAVAF